MRSTGWAGIAFCALLLAGPVLAACSSGDGGGGDGGDGDDQAYVTGLCKGIAEFGDGVDEALAGPTPADIGEAFEQIFKAMAKPLDEFSKTFAKLEPPSDLAEWHEKTEKQLAAAAKALKDGDLDDPALDAISDNPVPDMPEKPRQRLAALASKTKDCGELNPFDESSGGSSGFSGSEKPTQALKDAAAGTWTGKFGTLTFNNDGTAKFEIKNCGTDSSSGNPFGVYDDCPAQTYTGEIEVDNNRYTFTTGTTPGITFDAYVAKDRTLHVGVGSVSDFGPGQKGTIDVFAAGTLTVDGTNCTMKDFASSKDSKKVDCAWKKVSGQDVLEFEGSFDTEQIVILGDEGLAVSPNIFVASFSKK
jgi:hypothetical protein